jgi:hypothetical protein
MSRFRRQWTAALLKMLHRRHAAATSPVQAADSAREAAQWRDVSAARA